MRGTELDGKVAVVTGGGSGIGRALCGELARRGARVVAADVDAAGAEETAAGIRAGAAGPEAGPRALARRVDVTDPGDVEALMAETVRDFGRIDFLFNNAGVSANGEFQDIGPEHWKRILDVNLWGVVHGCRAAYPRMVRQGFGHIVNTASLAGLIPGSLTSAYSASKHAVVGLSLTLRAEARTRGVRVTALCPGYIRTPILKTTPTLSPYMDSPRNRAMNEGLRFPGPEDCAPAMVRGVLRNKAVVIAPASQAIYWLLYRLAPALLPWAGSKIVETMRRNAEADGR